MLRSASQFALLYALGLIAGHGAGCATIRVTDPPRTATEQFLMSTAVSRAVDQLSFTMLRGRNVYLSGEYLLPATRPSVERGFMLGELRAKLLMSGARLVNRPDAVPADKLIILEVRSGGVGVDRMEYLLGIPAVYVPVSSTVPLTTPELAIVKNTRQRGFAGVALVAYWADTGELVHNSGPFTGRSVREDWWILGFGPRTVGNIPPTEPPRR